MNKTHHPDCLFWADNYPAECGCGLTAERPAGSTLEPWDRDQFVAWADRVKREIPE